MDVQCSALGSVGHLWRQHGTYRRGDGRDVRRWQCGACRKTTTRRPGRDAPPRRRPGPHRGHTVTHSGGPEAFWALLAENVVRVGLHESTKVAAKAVGIHPTTGSRWLRTRARASSSDVEGKLLSGALEALQGRRELPAAAGIDAWRRIRGWKYPQLSEGNFGEPKESRLLRREGRQLWSLLLEAASVASVVAGEGSPLEFGSLTPHLSEPSVDALREGGLLSRPVKDRRYSYWLSFEQTTWDSWAIAVVCTRTRVIGRARAKFSWLPPMTVRLDLDRAWSSWSSVIVPVPSATQTYHRTPLTFPLELQLD